MRFYDIQLSNGREWTSLFGGIPDPGALNIELDFPLSSQASPQGNAWLRIWGISVEDINSAANLANVQIKVLGGMSAGLPLANPAEQGVLVQGYIYQGIGNWQGTDMTLDFIIAAGPGPVTSTPNLTFNWKKGTELSQAIQTTLQTAYPGIPVNVNISSGLVYSEDQPGYYKSIIQFAEYVRQISKDILNSSNQGGGAPGQGGGSSSAPSGSSSGGTGSGYSGVQISFTRNQLNVYDDNTQGSGIGSMKSIDYQDLIGQPTWIAPQMISVKTVMRGDLDLQDSITLPPTRTYSTAAANTSLVNQFATFAGGFKIRGIRHIGNFRQPSADSWCTVIEATPLSPIQGVGASSPGSPAAQGQ